MSHVKLRSLSLSIILMALILFGLLVGLAPPQVRGTESAVVGGQVVASESSTALLPLVTKEYPPPPSVFGVQMQAILEVYGLSKAVAADVHWVRNQAFAWDRIEPSRTDPPTYDWTVVDGAGLRNAYQNEMTLIAVVQYAPAWAQQYEDSACGPIRADRMDEYAQFLSALVSRYKDPPYNIKYWELGNEPDAPLAQGRLPFGCWGTEGDPYYGGAVYGEMLRHAYPAIKAADPEAQVLIGGLLLDCDPTHPPPGKDCTSGRFLDGILSVGGGAYFDIVSYHGYALFDGSINQDLQHPYWMHRGGVVLGKADYLREVLDAHDVEKPLMHTEGSLICPPGNVIHCIPPTTTFYQKQADYAVWLYVRNWANDIMATVWYQFDGPGWRYSGMLDKDQAPKPVYHAFDFMTEELGEAWYENPVTQYLPVLGYSFGTPSKRIWVLLPPDGTVQSIALPNDVTRVYDKLGNDITPAGSSITIDGPVYVERP